MHPLAVGLLLLGLLAAGVPILRAEVTIRREPYRGWSQAVNAGNGVVEAVMVPEVGRVMQFRFRGEPDGPFWENEKMLGKPMPDRPWEAAHGSFGGDKTWPAPQSAWNWPPPDIFDASPLKVEVSGDQSVILTSPVSPRFGIRTRRRVVLHPSAPEMRIETTYEKVSGEPVEVGVWVITQMKSPEAVLVPIPRSTQFPAGSSTNWGIPPHYFTVTNGLGQFTRDTRNSHKIGNDAEQMVWVGKREVMRIDLPREAGGVFPDSGCSVEVYSNPDPVPYVELETLGPLHRLAVGDRLSATNTYRLFRRQESTPVAEAHRVLAK